jgi:hypothetical protein
MFHYKSFKAMATYHKCCAYIKKAKVNTSIMSRLDSGHVVPLIPCSIEKKLPISFRMMLFNLVVIRFQLPQSSLHQMISYSFEQDMRQETYFQGIVAC